MKLTMHARLMCAGCAIFMSFAVVSGASAEFVDWYGNGVLTNVKNCPTGNFDQHVNKIFHARYLPPNLGTNGNKSSLSFLNPHWAQGYARSGSFTSTFGTVTSSTVARFPGPSGYTVKVRLTKLSPSSVTETTPMIVLEGQVHGFSGFPDNNNCTVNFRLTLFRP